MMAKEQMVQQYRTVEHSGQADIEEKKSRFIADVKPAQSAQQALAFIDEIKDKYPDATHHVYAYIIGNSRIQRYNDDGEPSGTAGIPVLEVIKKEQVQDLVVVVTRYFGGTLLGTGGLVRAYAKSAKQGLDAAHIVTMVLSDVVKLEVSYPLWGKVENEIISMGYQVDTVQYHELVRATILIETKKAALFIKKMVSITNNRVTINKEGSRYYIQNRQQKKIT